MNATAWPTSRNLQHLNRSSASVCPNYALSHSGYPNLPCRAASLSDFFGSLPVRDTSAPVRCESQRSELSPCTQSRTLLQYPGCNTNLKMPLLKTMLHYAGLGKKDKMANSDFQPTDIFQHRYQDPQVLVDYVNSLPDKFYASQFSVKACEMCFHWMPDYGLHSMQVLKDGRLGLMLPRKLTKVGCVLVQFKCLVSRRH